MGLHEACGVFGVYSPVRRRVAEDVYYGLYALQHRGQESAGIVVNDDGMMTARKDLGLVSEVFDDRSLKELGEGTMAVGHVRYSTAGGSVAANCHPLVVNHKKGKMALAHNGNIANALDLRDELELNGAIFQTSNDTEIICHIITRERIRSASIEEAAAKAMAKLIGSYSIVLVSSAKLLAIRDPWGFRPLCYGRKPDGTFVVSSETCGLTAVGAEFIRDVEPGEIVSFSRDGVKSFPGEIPDQEVCGGEVQSGKPPEQAIRSGEIFVNGNPESEGYSHEVPGSESQGCVAAKPAKKICIFEYIYFSRPDSVVDGVSVHRSRMRAGEILAEAHPADADIVAGVPDSGLDAAMGFSAKSGIPYRPVFIKNKYIGRTFIAPGQESRMDQVRIKLSPIEDEVRGKRIVLVDDSMVRGTTSRRTVELLREAGAKEIHLRFSAPPFRHPCFYGIDVDSEENLIACHYSIPEIGEMTGVDSIGFLPVESLGKLIGREDGYCAACFDGNYPTAVPEDMRKDRFEQKLSERTD